MKHYKLITKLSQLPKGVIAPKLPVVLNTETGKFQSLSRTEQVFKEDPNYVAEIRNLCMSTNIPRILGVVTGVKTEGKFTPEDYEKIHEVFKKQTGVVFSAEKMASLTDSETLGTFSGVSNIYRTLTYSNILKERYFVKDFDTSDRVTVLRRVSMVNQGVEIPKTLRGKRCIGLTPKGALMCVAKVTKVGKTWIELEVIGLSRKTKVTEMYLKPLC